MTHAESYSRPSKGILKVGKHAMLSRSASLQSKRTCFKEDHDQSSGDVGGLTKNFNFGCSLDQDVDFPEEGSEDQSTGGVGYSLPDAHHHIWQLQQQQHPLSPLCVTETIPEDDGETTVAANQQWPVEPHRLQQPQGELEEDFRVRRKSFEMKPLIDSFEGGMVNLRAILAHRVPDFELGDLDDSTLGATGDNSVGDSISMGAPYNHQFDVEMLSPDDDEEGRV